MLQDCGVPEDESRRLAALVKDEDVDRVYRLVAQTVGSDAAKQLFRNNSDLALLNEAEAGRYASALRMLVPKGARYGLMEFDPAASPGSFSSLDALAATKRKMDALVQSVSSAPPSDLDRIKERLSAENFDAETAIAVLRYGFWYGGEYRMSKNPVQEDKVIANVFRHEPTIDPRLLHRTLRKLVVARAVLDDRGLGLNPHHKQVAGEAAREALAYILNHHPTEG